MGTNVGGITIQWELIKLSTLGTCLISSVVFVAVGLVAAGPCLTEV